MNQFPSLSNWFRFLEQNELYDQTKTINKWYYEHNECLFFTLLWKDWADKESFIKEFVKLIARTRKPSQKHLRHWINIFDDFISFIDTWNTNIDLDLRKEFVKAIFTIWLYNWDHRNQDELDKWLEDKWIIKEWLKGYIGEVFYYLIRKEYHLDSLFEAFPNNPKPNPSEAGLDFTEIRKDNNWYYLIIWEVKTTDHKLHSFKYTNKKWSNLNNNYNEKPNEIINQLSTRPEETFNDHCVHYQEFYWEDIDLNNFLDNIENYVYDLSWTYKNDRKRLYWVVNYSWNILHDINLFKDFKSKTSSFISHENHARIVKLLWISDFEDIRNTIWDIIFNKYLK